MSSFFWRNPLQQQVVLGLFRTLYDPDKPQRILDVGCSSGEMTLTYAMLLQDEYGDGWHKRFPITAIDMEENAIQRCFRGIYPGNLIYQTPRSYRNRFFDEYLGAPAAMGRVSAHGNITPLLIFKTTALQRRIDWTCQDFADFADPGPFSLVFCQNTLIHMTDDEADRALYKLHSLLIPGGFLVCAGKHPDGYATIYELGFHPVPHNIELVYSGWIQRKQCKIERQRLKGYNPDDPLLPFKIGSLFRKDNDPDFRRETLEIMETSGR